MQPHDPSAAPPLVEQLLNGLLDQKIQLYLITGVKLTGQLLAYDDRSVLIAREQGRQLILLQAVSTIQRTVLRIEQDVEQEV